MASEIEVIISGVEDSSADYDDEVFLQADERARRAIAALYDAGAKVGNIAEAVQGGLEDADSRG
jgi:hypothetical protein